MLEKTKARRKCWAFVHMDIVFLGFHGSPTSLLRFHERDFASPAAMK
jgi:hypothetical protein